jgi:probable F420-dependent oxidoreductase
MRFAISIPQGVRDGGFDPTGFREHLRRTEALGFESAWTQESIFSSSPSLTPNETLAYAASCTERLRLGCAVYVTPLHSPIHLAQSITSLDQLSRGRIEVGIGTGGPGRMFSAFGVERERFVGRFTEGLALMKACWTESKIEFDGDFWQVHGAAMEPKPVQKPHPPIWFGGSHPAALRRAVRHGDGFFGAGASTTEQFVEHMRIVREALAEDGRDPAGFAIAKRVYITVDDDPARARKRTDEALERHYGRAGLATVAVTGAPDACVRGLRDVSAAGAELIQLNTLFDDAEQMERLAAEVLPQLG